MTKAMDGVRPGLAERLGASLKALTGRKVPFANISASGVPGASVFGGGMGGLGPGGRSPGATFDYGAAAGELWENRVVAACVNAVAQALCDAPPYLEKREGTAWVKVDTHPVITLLNQPNGYYGSPHLWSATAASECTAGQAFWRIEKDRAGLPVELWWEDARRFRALGDAERFISGYRFQTERGSWVNLDNDEVIHFRYALSPYNPREGRTPLSTGLRQVALDNGIASYSGSILRNSGVMSLLVSAKDATAGAQLAPAQIQEFVDKLTRRLFGEGAGGIAGINLPLDVQKMSFSPDEMAVDRLTAYAEASICALLGVDPMVCGLGSGTQQKTYANLGEALNDFWERRIIPTKNRHSAELGAQLLPLFGLEPHEYRISWDYSKVAALQENEDQKHARVRADYQAGLLDLFDAQTLLGIATDESRRGQFYGKPAPSRPPGLAPATKYREYEEYPGDDFDEDFGEDFECAIAGVKRYDPNQPRNERGEWEGSSGARIVYSDRQKAAMEKKRTREQNAAHEMREFLRKPPTERSLALLGLNHWKPAATTPELSEHRVQGREDRAFNRTAAASDHDDLLKAKHRGDIGESIVARKLMDEGAVWVLTRKDAANGSIDLVVMEKSGNVRLLEVKTGKVNASAREWKISPGYSNAEDTARAKMTPEEKREYETYRINQAVRRKTDVHECLQVLVDEGGPIKKVSLETYGVIIDTAVGATADHSTGRVDIHRIDGVHKQRLNWSSPLVDGGYQGSYDYDLRRKGTKSFRRLYRPRARPGVAGVRAGGSARGEYPERDRGVQGFAGPDAYSP